MQEFAANAEAAPVAGVASETEYPTGTKNHIGSSPTPVVEGKYNHGAPEPVSQDEVEKSGVNGAHEGGQIVPSELAHGTKTSVSQLHVPGEFPKSAA